MSLLLLLIVYPILSESSYILCNEEQQCSYSHRICTNNQDCTIICSANKACLNTIFTCPSSNSKCNVICNSTLQAAACGHTTIDGSNSILTMTTYGWNNQFAKGRITCGNNKQCNIQCGNETTNNYMCSNTIMDGADATQLNITGYGANTLHNSTIYCPNNGNCNITVIGNHGALIPKSKIYIFDPYETKLSLKCKTNDILNCYGGTGNAPILFCYYGKYNCSYITDDGINWRCKDRNSPCYIPIINISTTDLSSTDLLSTEITITSAPNMFEWSYSEIQYLIISGVVLIVIAIIGIVTWSKFKEYRKENEMLNKWVFYIALIKMVCIWMSYGIWIVIIFMDNDDSLEYFVCGIVMYLFFAINWMSLYLFMLNKLYNTFKDSIYCMSRKYLYFHIIILIFIPIWYSLITISHTIIINDNVRIYLLLSLIGSVIIFVGLLTLILSFNTRLFRVIIASAHSLINCNGDNQDRLLQLITKQTLLGSIMIFNMIVFVIIVLILTCLRTDTDSTEWIIYEWILAALIIMNCLSIFFGFKMNENEYDRIYVLCHKKLISFCKLLSILMNPNDQTLIESSLAKNVSSDLQFEDELYVHK